MPNQREHASPKRSTGAQQRKLKDLQDRTRSEKERFPHYRSAREIVENYKQDLPSPTANRVDNELDELKLPTLPSVKDEFLQLAGDMRI